jgi:glycosyltransferase involved in cell wall biosynthesis
MVNINIVGQILGTSGYANHTRKLFKALYKLEKNISLNAQLHPGWELMVSDAEMAAINQGWYPDGITICINMPHQWTYWRSEPCKEFWGFCVWEGDKIPPGFFEHFDKCDRILVPSAHVKDAIKTVYNHPDVNIVPHGVDMPLIENEKPELFTFLANKGWRGANDRGGMQYVFRAFAEEFGKGEPVQLKCKINPAYNTPQFNLANEFNNLGLPEDRPQILINTSEVDDKVMGDFYSGHVFVAPSKAEAWNLPVLEAMSHGIPAIVTGWSGPAEYVEHEVDGYHIDYTLKEVTDQWMYESISWAEPDLNHLKKLMRNAYENQTVIATMGELARDKAAKMTWDASAKKLKRLLDNI